MITFPNAKINLGLNITEKRPDGYHNLETVFYPIPLEDALEITILNDSKQKFVLHQSGLEISGEPETNLVVKAYLLLEQEFQLPPERISVGTCKTGCLCLDPRRLFTNTTSLPGSFIERNYKTSGKRMEKLHVQ